MGLFTDLNELYDSLQLIVDNRDDIENLYTDLEKVHFELLNKHLIERESDEYSSLDGWTVLSKVAFFILTEHSNLLSRVKADHDDIFKKCYDVAGFCFELLAKSPCIEEEDKWEYNYFSSVCYTLADKQANSVVMAKEAYSKLTPGNNADIYKLLILVLQRDFKRTIRGRKVKSLNSEMSLCFESIIGFSHSMMNNIDHADALNRLNSIEDIIKNETLAFQFKYKTFLYAVKCIAENSIRAILNTYPKLQPYIDVLTKVDTKNVFEWWPSQKIISDKLNSVLSSENEQVLISMPTSAGKTLVAELLIYNQFASMNGLAIYVVPSIALTNEVESNLYKRFRKVGIDVKREADDYDDATSSIYILTPEKLDLLIRKNPNAMSRVNIVVFDEFHKVGDLGRGWLLETLVAWFYAFQRNYGYKIIMMSAIMDDINDSINTKNISVYADKWSPTRKIYGAFFLPRSQQLVYKKSVIQRNAIIEEPFSLLLKYHDSYKTISNVYYKTTKGRPRVQGLDSNHSDTKYDVSWKTINTIKSSPILIYFFQKKDIASFIERSRKYRVAQQNGELDNLIRTIRSKLGEGHPLCECLRYSVAYHTGDLPEDVRLSIENAYRTGIIDILACTTTLADGVNLPVSTLVIGSVANFDFQWYLSGSDYKNIVGRIGRALIDTEGRVFIIKHTDYYSDEAKAIVESFMEPDSISTPLVSSLDKCSLEGLDEIERVIDLEEYAATAIANELQNIIDRIQIFSFSLFEQYPALTLDEFEDKYRNCFIINIEEDKRLAFTRTARQMYSFAENIPSDFLSKCNNTGLSYRSNKKLFAIAEGMADSSDVFPTITEDIYNEILKIEEFEPRQQANHFKLLKAWLDGTSYVDLRNEFFVDSNISSNTENCTSYIRDMFQYKLPWAFSALLSFCDPLSKSALSGMPQYVKYGTMSPNAITLCAGGINSRELAIKLSNAYDKYNLIYEKIEDWMVDVSQYDLQKYLSESFDNLSLSQLAKYRSIHRVKTTELQHSKYIKCNIAGTTFHQYKIAYDEGCISDGSIVLFEQDKKNPYDMYAVKIYTSDMRYQLGYIPAKYSEEVFDMIESGNSLYGQVADLSDKRANVKIIVE